MSSTKIVAILGREVLDSRGNPTVEAEVRLASGVTCTAIAPSGASTGKHEALELRDGDMQRYAGLGVLRACRNVSGPIADALCGMEADDQHAIDEAMIRLDGTKDKSVLGANAMLAASVACGRAAACAQNIPLFRHWGGMQAMTLPMPMMNILNGGAHAGNGLDIQEFMIVPVGAKRFTQALEMGVQVYHALRSLLKKRGLHTSVGDEGGFAPDIAQEEQAIELILEAITRAGYAPNTDFMLALDAAASEWVSDDGYDMPKSGRRFTADELIAHWQTLIARYPICSIEDPLGEEDIPAWTRLTRLTSGTCMLVGDDLFVTNPERIRRFKGCGDAVLLKPNQIGTISETIDARRIAGSRGMRTILSHRSGDTEDAAIADLAVALNCGYIKTGAPCRAERTAKYNRLLRIEQALGRAAVFGEADP